MIRVFILIFLFLILSPNSALANEGIKISSIECRFSLIVPTEWKVSQSPSPDNNCVLEFEPKENSSKSSTPSIQISLVKKEFLHEASELGFDFYNGKWVAVGRQSTFEPAKLIEYNSWTGIQGVMFSGCHDEKGYAGMCPHFTMLLREKETIDGTAIKVLASDVNEDILSNICKTIEPVF